MSPFDKASHGEYFIIEHPTRGTFSYYDGDPHFSTTGMRTDPEKSAQFATVEQAARMIEKFPTRLQAKCRILDARYSFAEVGTTEFKYMVRGSCYEPSNEGADKDGYIIFYEIEIATSEDEAIQMAAEDYGEGHTIRVHGIAKTKKDEDAWLARNPD